MNTETDADADADSDTGTDSDPDPDPETVVQTASDAAEEHIFSAYKQSAVRDYDVTVVFEEGLLEVDVYLNAPEDEADPEAVADEAALAARAAVDELFDE